MRMTVPLILAVALTASAPALAQDANNMADANAAAPVTTDANLAAPVASNDMAAAPVAEPTATPVDETTAPPPPAEKKSSFPWGVVGLLGLLGLIPRRGR